jgi:hypothetical protein
MKSYFIFMITLASLISFTSCAKKYSSASFAATKVVEDIGCENFQSKIFDALYDYVNTTKTLPEISKLKKDLEAVIEKNLVEVQFIQDQQSIAAFKTAFINYIAALLDSASHKEVMTKEELLQALIEFELQDQSSQNQIALNNFVQNKLDAVKAQSKAMNLSCNTLVPDDEQTQTPTETPIQQQVADGINTIFAVAYQSCRAIEVPPLNEDSPNIEGVTILSAPNPENGGLQRVISSVSKVQESHPWIRVSSPGSNTCYNVRGNPLIYDFGGKPKWSSNTIDFFNNSGSGTSVLGVDCSGFVASVLSAIGARYAPGSDNKPVYVNQKSDKFIDAKSSGFKCFDNISLNSKDSIKPGDIAAIKGHVVIVDSIGADPFGLKRISSSSKCNQVSLEFFDFVIAQSSPSKNGIGINKFKASHYLKDSPEMAALFLDMAKASCQAVFTLKTITPKFVDYGIIRHKGTKDCMAPKVALAKQACVSACIK